MRSCLHATDDYNTAERASKRRRTGEAEEHQEYFQSLGPQEPAAQYGHRYGNIAVSSEGRAHIGDTIIHNHIGPRAQADLYNTLFTSLKFDRIDARLRNVAAALPM